MRRPLLIVSVLLVLIVGCNSGVDNGQRQAPHDDESHSVQLDSPQPFLQVKDWGSSSTVSLGPTGSVTADMPVYAGSHREGFPDKGIEIRYVPGGIDSASTLLALAHHLDQTGNPSVPEGTQATLVGSLEGGNFVYRLWNGANPSEPHVWSLRREEEGWVAVPICRNSDQWLWSNALDSFRQPVVICGGTEGSAGSLTVAAYRGGAEVFRAQGLIRGGVEIGVGTGDGPPSLILYRALHWYSNYHEVPVFERVMVTWVDGSYRVNRIERKEDWAYHVVRFLTFLHEGDLDRAQQEMAVQPSQGLETYLRSNAPLLLESDVLAWLQVYHLGDQSVLLNRGDPTHQLDSKWVRFDFSSKGDILAVGQQDAAPR
jgi:hypothetical protein